MRRMIDNKKLKEMIESSGGTQWYKHRLYTSRGRSIEFVLPFETNLFEIDGLYSPINVFGVVLQVNGPSVGNIEPSSTFPILSIFTTEIRCYTAKSDGTIASTKITLADYAGDEVTKYQVF